MRILRFCLDGPRSSLAFLLPLCLAVGCGQDRVVEIPADQPIQVAICDLTKVATELGLQEEMLQLLAAREKQLTEEVQKIQKEQEEGLQKKLDEYGEKPTDQQKRELTQLHSQALQAVRIAQANATNLLNQDRLGLVQQVRRKLQPAVDRIANEKGIRIVVTRRPDFLVFVHAEADITYDVVRAAKEETSAAGLQENP